MFKTYSREAHRSRSAKIPVAVDSAKLFVKEDAKGSTCDNELLMRPPSHQSAQLSISWEDGGVIVSVRSPVNWTARSCNWHNSLFHLLFNDFPTRTSLLKQDIDAQSASPINQHPLQVNLVKHGLMKKEAEYLLKHGLAIPSSSVCSSVPSGG